ncbi:kinase-like domain-containing protein [Russula earlei]|uniref:Kinase-like domain-containing protein n=1 Tax=Russula earlei TaxID=71964 RepID=A0ACC0TW94_9AGAM|nr:kinase-like domain-containing protein [Russula earlei]
MTNTSSGSKRPSDGFADTEHRKRSRDSETRDSKDPRTSGKSYGARDRYSADDRFRRDHSPRRDHDRDYRVRDDRWERDGRRDRARRDSDRYRDRRHEDRGRRSSYVNERRHCTPTAESPRRPSNGSSRPRRTPDSDREEGEISPHPLCKSSPGPRKMPTNLETSPSCAPPPNPTHPMQSELDLELATSPVPNDVTLAARRAKRQAILAKYAGVASVNTAEPSPSPGPSSAVQPPLPSTVVSDHQPQYHSIVGQSRSGWISRDQSAGPSHRPESQSASPAPDIFELAKGGEEEGAQAEVQEQAKRDGAREQVSAADYDPSLDRREDEQRRVRGGKAELSQDVEMIEEGDEEDEGDVDDMFAVSTADKKKGTKVKKKPALPALITTTLDTAADPEGYYQVILGEHLDSGRYQVFSSVGKGMFANVVRARVLQSETGEVGKEVAIKIIRSQESMYKAGQKEVQILNRLKQSDPDDKKHVVRLERTFEHRGHLCLVFESLSMNLRDVVKRFGKDVGLNIRAVRAYAQQLFLALSLLRKCNIMHADIKPDNILVNEQKTQLKLCDLGSASDASENEITPYLVSRFYRAPEIILGMPYDPALDVWSVGCTLYELYTGKILLPGRSNNQMLLLMMELKGRFNQKMLKRAKFEDSYFDEMGGFESIERDKVTGADVVRKVHISKPTRDMRTRLMPPSSAQMKDDERKLLLSFVDLLDRCLALDPARRITPKESLMHPFLRG